jgi:hypothetical protein
MERAHKHRKIEVIFVCEHFEHFFFVTTTDGSTRMPSISSRFVIAESVVTFRNLLQKTADIQKRVSGISVLIR